MYHFPWYYDGKIVGDCIRINRRELYLNDQTALASARFCAKNALVLTGKA